MQSNTLITQAECLTIKDEDIVLLGKCSDGCVRQIYLSEKLQTLVVDLVLKNNPHKKLPIKEMPVRGIKIK